MLLNILRGVFVLLMGAVGYSLVAADPNDLGRLQGKNWLALAMCLTLAVLVIAVDILAGRRKLAVFSGLVLGVMTGLALSYVLSFAVVLVVDNVLLPDSIGSPTNVTLAGFLNLLIGTVVCYFCVSFILQTKDDFRFIIPYVEFRRDARGARPVVVDTSALIDGRLEPVAAAGFLDTRLVVPEFVVRELQRVADSPDRGKRLRGRRGLEVLARLRQARGLDVRVFDTHAHEPRDADDHPVDRRLIDLARQWEAKALTVDHNLAKVAQLAGVAVLNLNDLADGLRGGVVLGEARHLTIERTGTGQGQGVGHLDDGTMVVVEGAADAVGEKVDVVVTNTTQTSAGRMVFARRDGSADAPADEEEPSEAPRPQGKRRRFKKLDESVLQS